MTRKSLILLVFLMILVTGCSSGNMNESANIDSKGVEAYYAFTDSLGNSVILEKNPKGLYPWSDLMLKRDSG